MRHTPARGRGSSRLPPFCGSPTCPRMPSKPIRESCNASFKAGGIFGLGAHGSVGGSLAAPVSKNFVALHRFFLFSADQLRVYVWRGQHGQGSIPVGTGGRQRRSQNPFSRQRRLGAVRRLRSRAAALLVEHLHERIQRTSTVHESNDELAGNVSAGALYYISQHIGLELELKGYVARDYHFGRATAGLFFQFP